MGQSGSLKPLNKMKSLTSFDRQLAADFRAVLQEEKEARGLAIRKPATRRLEPAPKVHTFRVEPRVTHKASGLGLATAFLRQGIRDQRETA